MGNTSVGGFGGRLQSFLGGLVGFLFRQVTALILLSVALLTLSLILNIFLRWLVLPSGSLSYERALYFDYTQPVPTAVTYIKEWPGEEQPTGLLSKQAFGEGDVKNVGFLGQGQAYGVSLHLHVPESTVNQNVGMFQVTMELITTRGEVVASQSQPCMLRYRSVLMTVLTNFLRLPLLPFYDSEEVQDLYLNLFPYKVEKRALPLAGVQVKLHPRFGRRTPPQVYSAHVIVDLHVSFFLRLLHRFALSTLGVGVITVFLFLFAFSLFVIAIVYFCTSDLTSRDEREVGDDPLLHPPPLHPPVSREERETGHRLRSENPVCEDQIGDNQAISGTEGTGTPTGLSVLAKPSQRSQQDVQASAGVIYPEGASEAPIHGGPRDGVDASSFAAGISEAGFAAGMGLEEERETRVADSEGQGSHAKKFLSSPRWRGKRREQ
mmetsp:Transcript_45355/g.75639  ORF Transcript_45355/g.75639 Transcript_45355/m.75639 type:complete len:435 (+) Transcript_45355:573-1877(+)